jgi:hypothetical protein
MNFFRCQIGRRDTNPKPISQIESMAGDWSCESASLVDGGGFLKRGEPQKLPDMGRIVLARMGEMAAQEEQLQGPALFVNILGEVRITPTELMAALEV